MSKSKAVTTCLILIFLIEAGVIFIFFSSFEKYIPQNLSGLKILPTREKKPITIPESATLSYHGKTFVVTREQIQAWLKENYGFQMYDEHSLKNYYLTQIAFASTKPWNFDTLKHLALNYRALGEYLSDLATSINREPQDAELEIENERAKKFVPQSDGQTLSLNETQKRLAEGLLGGKTEVELAVQITKPPRTLADLNTLGIKELVTTGQSDFSGSSVSRIQNIRVGSSQYNGVIIKPGEEFSFNKYLGPINAEHGYKPELVIKPEGSTPEFGGGLCQVSTTAFRAAFFAGLPITARRNHSYAVHYYEWISDDRPRAVGLDATIYSGIQDMKFINDTPGAILIWTRIEGRRLYFDFYGTKDEREVMVDGPHPYDRRQSGAVKSKVTRIVKKPNGAPVEVIFQSNYVPPKTLPAVVEYPKPLEPAPPVTEPLIQTQ